MKHSRDKSISLKAIRDKFELYRSRRAKRGRLPDYLWKYAVQVAETYSVQIASVELKLDYNKVKRKLKKHAESGEDPKFIEFKISDHKTNMSSILFDIKTTDGVILSFHDHPVVVDKISGILRRFSAEMS